MHAQRRAAKAEPCSHFLSPRGCSLGAMCPMTHVSNCPLGDRKEQEQNSAPASSFALPFTGQLRILWLWRGNTYCPGTNPLHWRVMDEKTAAELEQSFVQGCGKGAAMIGQEMRVSFDDMTIRTIDDFGNRRPVQRILIRDAPEWIVADPKTGATVEKCDAVASHALECEFARGEVFVVCVKINGQWTRVNFATMTATRNDRREVLRVVRHPIVVYRGSDPSDPYKHPKLRRQVQLFDSAIKSGLQLPTALAPSIVPAMDNIEAGESPFIIGPDIAPRVSNADRSTLPWCPKAVCALRHDAHHLYSFRHRCAAYPGCGELASSDPSRHAAHSQLCEHGDAAGLAITNIPRVKHGVLKVFRTFWEDCPTVSLCEDTSLGTVLMDSKEYVEFLEPILHRGRGEGDAAEQFRWIQRVQNGSHVPKYLRIRNDICRQSGTSQGEQVLFTTVARSALYDVFSCRAENPFAFCTTLDQCKPSDPVDSVVLVVVAITGQAATVSTPDDALALTAPAIPVDDGSTETVVRDGATLPRCVTDSETGRIWLYDPAQWMIMYIVSFPV